MFFLYLDMFSLLHSFIMLLYVPLCSMITKLFEKGFFSGIKKLSNMMEHLQMYGLITAY